MQNTSLQSYAGDLRSTKIILVDSAISRLFLGDMVDGFLGA